MHDLQHNSDVIFMYDHSDVLVMYVFSKIQMLRDIVSFKIKISTA